MPTTLFTLHFFPLFQLTFLFNCLHFFLQSFLRAFFVVDRVIALQKKDFGNSIGIMIVRECQKASEIDKYSHTNSGFSKTTGLITWEKVANELLVFLECDWIKKLSIPELHLSLDGPKMPELFVSWAIFDFGTRISAKKLA